MPTNRTFLTNCVNSIVFSAWKRSIDCLAQLLLHAGIVFSQVDGTLRPWRRQEVLDSFYHESSERVLLMTLGTGGTGYTILLSWAEYLNADEMID